MRLRFIILCVLLTALSHSSFGQVVITEEADVSRVMSVYRSTALQNDYVIGWRIQLINTDDRRQMESAIAKFQSLHPGMKTEWKHVQPYYQVVVGYYRTKLDVEPFLRKLKADFPRCIAVRTKIDKLAFFE